LIKTDNLIIVIREVKSNDSYLKNTLCFLEENQRLLVTLSSDVVVGSVNQFVENYGDFFLVNFDLLVIVLIKGV
jgi:hypothetical protein